MLRWWVPLALLALCFAVVGLRFGWQATRVTEGAVIERFAAQYVAEAGPNAALSDCLAVPGAPGSGVWIEVRCTPRQGAGRAYLVNRFGYLKAAVDFPSEDAEAPEA